MIMYREIKNNISDSYRKNKDDLLALMFQIYPEFLYKKCDRIPTGEIPVFTFHSVEPASFERRIRYLADNNYETLNSDAFYNILTGKKKYIENNVLLTFDDGVESLWSTAYPILKKYGMVAISFIVTGRVREKSTYYPNLEEVWKGKATIDEIRNRGKRAPLCSWEEIKEMHGSGTIDFQSHTYYHNSVFISDKIIDFINPAMKTDFIRSSLNPVIRRNGRDVVPEVLGLGRPIYEWSPAMKASNRYLENEALGNECEKYVLENGGIAFFTRFGWRRRLQGLVKNITRKNGNPGRFQSADERYEEIRRDLFQSKMLIEEKLNKKVHHLCYPWYEGGDLSVNASKETGYWCNHWGIMKDRAVNKVGDDPFFIARIDGDYIDALPGKGRISAYEVFKKKVNDHDIKRIFFG